jgi:hypothetical protein
MDVYSGLSGGMFTKQKPDEQSQHGDGDPAGRSQQPSYRDGIGTACRIVTVAQQADVIGPSSDEPIAGADNRKPKRQGIDGKAGEGAHEAAVGAMANAADGCANWSWARS